MTKRIPTSPAFRTLAAWVALAALVLPGSAAGASTHQRNRQPATALGTLVQLPGSRGCLVDWSQRRGPCGPARALRGPGPFMGSRAIALSPDGRNVYVASSGSDAIAIFMRNPRTGTLRQQAGTAGCIAARGAGGCATAVGLDGPNSVAVSADGRSVYATSRASNAVTVFHRNRSTGGLSQSRDGFGCISSLPLPGCTSGRALDGPDVVVVSPDGKNVYVGSFFGNAIAVFNRNPATGALTQPASSTGCITEAPTSGCATGLALEAPEGMAISRDGKSVYAATAVSNALVAFARNPSTGVLTQMTDGSGCIVASPLAGCTTGTQLSGANAVTVSPDDEDAYVTSLLSNSVTSFTRSASGSLAQKSGATGCVVFLRAVGCSFGRALGAPEGLAVSPDGANLYAAAFASGAIAVLNRNTGSGIVTQKPLRAGCVAMHPAADCSRAHMLSGVSSLALSPDGRYLYSTAFGSNAIDIFRRITQQSR